MGAAAGRETHYQDAPAAPDGSDRLIGGLRRPDPPPVRGPAAGVASVAPLGLSDVLGGAPPAPHNPSRPLPSDAVDFQHVSERGFARLLDFYGISWEYEPDAFPIEWGDDESVQRWFRPDFYLPAFDTYIEITTSSQRLVTRKNRKLRLLRRHHPRISCKLFYQRDYEALMRRYGLDDGDAAEGP